MFSIPKLIPVSQPQPPMLPSSGVLERPIPTPFMVSTPFQPRQLSVSKVEAPILSAPVAIPVPVMPVTAPASVPIPAPHPTTASPKPIPLFSATNPTSVSVPKPSSEAALEPVSSAVFPAFSARLPTVDPPPPLRTELPEAPPPLMVEVPAHGQDGAAAVNDPDASGKSAPLVAGSKGPVVVACRGPDYRRWVYPTPQLPPPLSAEAGRLGVLAAPQVWAAPPFTELDATVVDIVPDPMCPDYVVFGGAQYHSFFPVFARGHAEKDKLNPKLGLNREDIAPLVELRRIQFMLDQLRVAQRYLQLKGIESKALTRAEQAPVSASQETHQDALPQRKEIDLTTADLEKGTLWTLAWAGSPVQLQDALRRLRCENSALDVLGYVTLSRHQWGLKRSKGEYILGLGMKATALQFAAVSGRLDNVIVLLSNGAADCFVPHLCDILPKRVYKLLKNVEKKNLSIKKPSAPLQISNIPLHSSPTNFPESACCTVTTG